MAEGSKFQSLCRPRTLFAFMFYGTFCYLVIQKLQVPANLNTIVSMLMGYYFGSKVKNGGIK